jgi:nucleoside-diphosphate-sugar epimerase
MMTSRALSNGRLIDPGGHGVPHAWAYLPDVARAGVLLIERHAELEPHAVFHFEGYEADGAAMLDAARRALSKPSLGAFHVPWWLLVVISPLSRMLRLLLSVRYLWTEAVLLDGEKLHRTLPEFRVTPLDEAVKRTLTWMATKHGDAARAVMAAPPPGAERAPRSTASTLA